MVTESRMVIIRDSGEGKMESYYLIGMKFQVEKMKMFWRWMVVMDAQQCESTECHRTVHLMVKMVKFVIYFATIKKFNI